MLKVRGSLHPWAPCPVKPVLLVSSGAVPSSWRTPPKMDAFIMFYHVVGNLPVAPWLPISWGILTPIASNRSTGELEETVYTHMIIWFSRLETSISCGDFPTCHRRVYTYPILPIHSQQLNQLIQCPSSLRLRLWKVETASRMDLANGPRTTNGFMVTTYDGT